MGNQKKKKPFYRLYVFLFFVGIFLTGGLYSNCGAINSEENVRQKIFIDEVQDIYPNRIDDVEQGEDGSYELKPVDLQD